MTLDDLLFLVERYGYARRDGEHQGKKSAEWMAEIGTAIDACVAEALAANTDEARKPTDLERECYGAQADDPYLLGYNRGFAARGEPPFAEALADPLTLLERLAREQGPCAELSKVFEDGSGVTLLVTYVGDGEFVYSEGVEPDIRELDTRAEALELLAGKENTDAGKV